MHPIRFGVGVALLLLVFTFLIIWVLRIKKQRKLLQPNESKLELKIVSEKEHENQASEQNIIVHQTSNQSLFKFRSIISHLFILIVGVVLGYLIHCCDTGNKIIIENPSISNSKFTFGLDVSHYQGHINWEELSNSHHSIEFVFIRATMGKDKRDKQFNRNWKNAKKYNLLRGAYHYYRPNENSTEQFQNFSNSVILDTTDLLPVLDIERMSIYGAENLRKGVLNWLKLAENKYEVKPIIYTGRNFYLQYLKGYVDEYPLWIASYSQKHKLSNVNWTFHQFTDKVRVKGINSLVDGNDFVGDLNELKRLSVRK